MVHHERALPLVVFKAGKQDRARPRRSSSARRSTDPSVERRRRQARRRLGTAARDEHGDEPRAEEDQADHRRCRRARARRPGRAASAGGAADRRARDRGSGLGRHGAHCGGARRGATSRHGLGRAPRAAPRVLGARPDRPQKETSSVDLFEYQGKQYFARYGIPVSPGGVADTVDEAVDAGRGGRLPGRRQGPGAGRRPRQGRRHQARQRRRRGAHARREHPRHGHQGPHRRAGLGRARLRHRRGVLRQLHARPGGQAAPADAVGRRAASRSRRSPATDPDAIVKLHIDPVDGLVAERRPARPPSTPGSPSGRSTAWPTSSSSSTTASPRATATWPRSTR